MREETRTGVDAEGNPRPVVILIPETPEDVEELQRRAAAGDVDDRVGFADAGRRRTR
jgi:hypothetical protein